MPGLFLCEVDVSEHLQLKVEITGNARTETVMGRPHKVFPAVLVREQILNNNLGRTFLPAEEIEASADAWNGMPVVVRHPTKRGQPVSARSPDVLEARGVGNVFNARFEDGSLKADVFVDLERTKAVEDAGDVVQNVERGQPGEVSTGFGTHVENTTGSHDGEEYEAVLRRICPDHLALLPTEKGACSVTDGCGLGVNHDGDCGCGDKNQKDGRFAQAVEKFVAFMSRLGPAPIQEDKMDREQVIVNLRDAGCPLSEERLSEMEDEELTALQESFPGESEPEPTPEEKEGVEALLKEMREEIAELKEATSDAVSERNEEKSSLVAALAKNERCAFEEEELEGMTLNQLRKLAQTAQVRNYAGRGAPKDSRNSEPTHMPVRPYWETGGKEED